MIYFIRSGNMVKIGLTGSLDVRIRTLQTSTPNDLVILGVCEGDREEEAALHRKFDSLRSRGEWFYLDATIARHIEENCRPCLLGISLGRHVERLPGLPDSIFPSWVHEIASTIPFVAAAVWVICRDLGLAGLELPPSNAIVVIALMPLFVRALGVVLLAHIAEARRL